MRTLQTTDGRYVQVCHDAWLDTQRSGTVLVSDQAVQDHMWTERVDLVVPIVENGPSPHHVVRAR